MKFVKVKYVDYQFIYRNVLENDPRKKASSLPRGSFQEENNGVFSKVFNKFDVFEFESVVTRKRRERTGRRRESQGSSVTLTAKLDWPRGLPLSGAQ